MRKTHIILILSALAGFFIASYPAYAQTANHLTISQVQITAGPGLTTNDFVEIFNPTEQPIDLQGYRLVKRTQTGTSDSLIKSFTDSIVIPPKGYFLWANSNFADIAKTPDITTSATISADNGVALRLGGSDTGEIIDSLAWGEAENIFVEGSRFPTNPDAGMALHRKFDGEDTNNNAQDFELLSSDPRNLSDSPMSNQEPEIPAPAKTEQTAPKPATPVNQHEAVFLVINEIFPNPSGTDSGLEWAELYNSTNTPLDLSGWWVDDSGTELGSGAYEIPDGTMLAGLDYYVVELPAGSFALNNTGGDCVKIYDPDKNFKKEICYADSAGEGKSFAKSSTGGYLWTDKMTPGSANEFSAQTIFQTQKGNIVINELLPNPEDDEEEEFIEFLNLDEEEIDLAGWVVTDQSRSYEIHSDDFSNTTLEPGGFLVVSRIVSKIALNNTRGEEVSLMFPGGEVVDRVSYTETARENWAYARTENGKYFWTEIATPGKENIFTQEVSSENVSDAVDSIDIPGEVAGLSTSTATIVALREVHSLKVGSRIQTNGQVVSLPNALGSSVVYLSGSGIRVFLASGTWPELALGDIVNITGEVGSYHNETQIKITGPDDISVTGQGALPSPGRIETGDVGEETEGHFVLVSGVVTSSEGDTFFIDDGSGVARIYIMDTTGIEKPKMRKGDIAVVRGIVSQFNDNYRVLPRMTGDIEVGQASSASTLSRTGIDYWFKVLILCVLGFLSVDLYDIMKSWYRKFV